MSIWVPTSENIAISAESAQNRQMIILHTPGLIIWEIRGTAANPELRRLNEGAERRAHTSFLQFLSILTAVGCLFGRPRCHATHCARSAAGARRGTDWGPLILPRATTGTSGRNWRAEGSSR